MNPTEACAPTTRRLGWLFALLVAGWFAVPVFWPRLYPLLGVHDFGVWFLDSFALLASNDALARGLDPWADNPLDYFNRTHVYSHWWLHLGDLGLTRAANFGLGLGIVLAFFAVVFCWLRPRTGRELVWYLGVVGSPPLLLAVNRANNDLVVFILLAAVVPCLLDPRRHVRLGAGLFIVAATGLKFYRAVGALVLLTGNDAAEVRSRMVIVTLLLVAVAIDVAPDLARIGSNLPQPGGLMTFGVRQLPEAWGIVGGWATAIGLTICCPVAIWVWHTCGFAEWRAEQGDHAVWLSFVLGAAVLTGCFFSGPSNAYRWAFAIWLTPLLVRLPRDPSAPVKVRRLAAATAGLLLVALWLDPMVGAMGSHLASRADANAVLRGVERFVILEQPLAWLLFTCFLTFLWHFIREAWQSLRARPEKR